ncbi:MAG TPA: hypothetical protein VK607_13920 [Kofleriaceae bacterium]|nr:hypothetical protein [Kofleriaceae bacterium]
MITAPLRSRRGALAAAAVALALAAPRLAFADDPPPGPPPGYPPPGAAPPGYPPPTSGPPGAQPTYGAPAYPPAYAPVYPPPGYAPVSGPEKITDFDEDQPVPFGYTRVSRTRKGMIIGGACLFGAVYGYTAFGALYAQALFAGTGSNNDASALFIPVAGPFLELGETDSSIARFGLLVDGAAQAAGALMLLYGLTTPRTILVRNDRLSRIPVIRPLVRHDATGLVVEGRF